MERNETKEERDDEAPRTRRFFLPNGEVIGVREIGVSSIPLAREALSECGTGPLAMRFGRPIKALTASEWEALYRLDGKEKFGVGAVVSRDPKARRAAFPNAFDGSESGQLDSTRFRGVGVARYAELGAGVVEDAVMVVDAFHRLGIAQLLVSLVFRAARLNGYEIVRGYILPENKPVLSWLERTGAAVKVSADDAGSGASIPEKTMALRDGAGESSRGGGGDDPTVHGGDLCDGGAPLRAVSPWTSFVHKVFPVPPPPPPPPSSSKKKRRPDPASTKKQRGPGPSSRSSAFKDPLGWGEIDFLIGSDADLGIHGMDGYVSSSSQRLGRDLSDEGGGVASGATLLEADIPILPRPGQAVHPENLFTLGVVERDFVPFEVIEESWLRPGRRRSQGRQTVTAVVVGASASSLAAARDTLLGAGVTEVLVATHRTAPLRSACFWIVAFMIRWLTLLLGNLLGARILAGDVPRGGVDVIGTHREHRGEKRDTCGGPRRVVGERHRRRESNFFGGPGLLPSLARQSLERRAAKICATHDVRLVVGTDPVGAAAAAGFSRSSSTAWAGFAGPTFSRFVDPDRAGEACDGIGVLVRRSVDVPLNQALPPSLAQAVRTIAMRV